METIERQLIGFVVAKFKSYYVVWKLAAEDCIKHFTGSLNRTMQYGNKFK